MKIQNFVRDNSYYSVLRDIDRTINSEDLDIQYNNLKNYINNKIISKLNGLVDQKLQGSTDLQDLNCYLENIGDGNTRWSKIKFDNLALYSLPLKKLQTCSLFDILSSNFNANFKLVSLNDNFQILTSKNKSPASWKYLSNSHFLKNSIPYTKVDYGVIEKDHFENNILSGELRDEIIISSNILNDNVIGSKIADGAIDDSKIDPSLLNRRNTSAPLAPKSLNSRNLKSNSLDENTTGRLFFNSNFRVNGSFSPEILSKIMSIIPNNGIALQQNAIIYPQYHIANSAIQLRHIKPLSFSFQNLNPQAIYGILTPNYLLNNYRDFYLQFLGTEHLSPKLKHAIGYK